jgi:hypothetical protein
MNYYHQPDISDSSLYNRSIEVNCILQDVENKQYMYNNSALNASFVNDSSTMMRGFIETTFEQKLRTDQFENKYRCSVESSFDNTTYPNALGYECNTNMMYELDEFNTYHNYPVCKIRENNEVSCCPENIQIFDNLTRRNVELSTHKPLQDLIIEQTIIPGLTYNKCHLYK